MDSVLRQLSQSRATTADIVKEIVELRRTLDRHQASIDELYTWRAWHSTPTKHHQSITTLGDANNLLI